MKWLALPEEARRFRRSGSGAEALAFIEEFWRRRDPDLDTPGNEVALQFFERVQAADILYSGEGTRGAMTDRARAYIVLGSPSVLRYRTQVAPAWRPGGGRESARPATARVRVETWGYRREDLSPALAALLEERGVELPVEISFIEEGGRTVLLSGEDLLLEAARAAIRR